MRAHRPHAHRRADRARLARGPQEILVPAPDVRVRAQGRDRLLRDREAQGKPGVLLLRALWPEVPRVARRAGDLAQGARAPRAALPRPRDQAVAGGCLHPRGGGETMSFVWSRAAAIARQETYNILRDPYTL